jgi:amino acid transporter
MEFEVKELKRSMKTIGALLITLSFITPASSVFIIAPGIVQQAGTGAFLSFILAAIVGVFTAFVYAELSSAYPIAGGEYAIIGRILGPFAGFVVLGVNIITMILMFAAISLGIAPYLQPIFPELSPVAAGLITVALTTLCALLNIRTNAIVTGIFLLIELLLLAGVAWLGFADVARPVGDFVLHPVYLPGSGGELSPASFGIIGLAIWAYNGYGQAVYIGEETHDAPKSIARVILIALAVTVLAELLPVTAMLMGAPDLKALLGSQNMFADFITTRSSPRVNSIISLGIALAIFNANIAIALMTARQIFSSGRDHVWPRAVNYAFTRIHKRFHSPWIATLALGAMSACACFISLNYLFIVIGAGIIFIYVVLCIAVIIGRRNRKTKHAKYRMPFYPLPPIAALLALGYVVYANYLDPDIGRPSLLATLGMIVISALYYVLVLRRRKGGWTLRGPV